MSYFLTVAVQSCTLTLTKCQFVDLMSIHHFRIKSCRTTKTCWWRPSTWATSYSLPRTSTREKKSRWKNWRTGATPMQAKGASCNCPDISLHCHTAWPQWAAKRSSKFGHGDCPRVLKQRMRRSVLIILTYSVLNSKYHCTADLMFYYFGFNQTSKSVVQAKLLNLNQSDRSDVQWYCPLQNKRVFSSLLYLFEKNYRIFLCIFFNLFTCSSVKSFYFWQFNIIERLKYFDFTHKSAQTTK